jgi:hypothetical protein
MVIIPFVAYELRKISDPKELGRPEKLQLSNHNLLAKRTLSVRSQSLIALNFADRDNRLRRFRAQKSQQLRFPVLICSVMLAAEYCLDVFTKAALPKHELLEVHRSKISLHRAKADCHYLTISLPNRGVLTWRKRAFGLA